MHRRFFFLLSGFLACGIGMVLLMLPSFAATQYGLNPSPSLDLCFRAMGAMIFATGFLNLIVRYHTDSESLRAILLFNIVSQVLNIGVDSFGMLQSVVTMSAMIPAQLVHLFILIGSWHYVRQLRRESAGYAES